jgi:hypothetical protein
MQSALRTHTETSLVDVTEGLKKKYDEAIRKVLKYTPQRGCEESMFPVCKTCLHYSDSQMAEGLIVHLTVGLKDIEDPGRGPEIPPRSNGLCISYDSEVTVWGYGERWKKLEGSMQFDMNDFCKKALGIPEQNDVYIMRVKKLLGMIGLENLLAAELPSPYIC